MNKEKVQYETIIGDPFATEEKWIPACTLASASPDSGKRERSANKLGAFGLALAGCYLVAFSLTNAVNIGYDWGYHAAGSIAGQSNTANQGIMANLTLGFAILPMIFGLSFGASIARHRSWRFWLPVGVLLAFVSSAIACIAVDSWSFFVRTLLDLEFWFYNVSILTMGILGLGIGKVLRNAIHGRVRFKPIALAVAFQSVAFGSLLFWHAQPIRPLLELVIYSTTLFLSAFISSYLSHPKDSFKAIAIPLIASFPIVLANFLNVLMNAVSLPLDQFHIGLQLGGQALLSSVLIFVVAVCALSLGGISARTMRRVRSLSG